MADTYYISLYLSYNILHHVSILVANLLTLTMAAMRIRVADVTLAVYDGVHARARRVRWEIPSRVLHVERAIVCNDLSLEHAFRHRTEHRRMRVV